MDKIDIEKLMRNIKPRGRCEHGLIKGKCDMCEMNELYEENEKLENKLSKLEEHICIYAREELGNMNFETDEEVLEYFSEFTQSNYS